MFKRYGALTAAALGLLGGCTSPADELRKEPVRFTTTQPMPYDTMALCIAREAALLFIPVLQIYPRDSVAYVTISDMAVFTVRPEGEGSVVDWRRGSLPTDLAAVESTSNAIVQTCRKAPS